MFIPIGDNIERRTFPLVTVVLIVANVLVFVLQLRTSYDAMKAAQGTRASAAPPLYAQHAGAGQQSFGRQDSEPHVSPQPGIDQRAPWKNVRQDDNPADDDLWEFDQDNAHWPAEKDNVPWVKELAAQQAANRVYHDAQFDFVKRWGLTPKELRQGQVMGLLTHMFLHGDIFHLLGNMLMLWAFAGALEAGFGHLTFLGFYILFGFAGGLGHCASDFSSELPLIGASGAIAGLIGAYTVLYGPLAKLKMLFFFFFRAFTFEIPAAAFGFGWFLLQLLQASGDPKGMGGVAWFAHIGGFMAGVVVTFICRHDTEQEITADVNGQLILQEKVQPAAGMADAAQAADAESSAPSLCPYCQADLITGHTLAPNLIRCGNAKCERMVYLESGAPSDLSLAGKRR